MPSFTWSLYSPAEVVEAEAAINRLAEYLRGKTKFEALLNALVAPSDDLDEAFASFDAMRSIDDATGVLLDRIGAILNRPRASLSDDDYRTFLRVQILINLTSGTVPELIEILQALAPGCTVDIVEWFPAALVADIQGVIIAPEDAELLAEILATARPAGIGATLKYHGAAAEETFTLDSGPGLDGGVLSDAFEA